MSENYKKYYEKFGFVVQKIKTILFLTAFTALFSKNLIVLAQKFEEKILSKADVGMLLTAVGTSENE